MASRKAQPLIYLDIQRDYSFLIDLFKSQPDLRKAHIFFPYPKLKEKVLDTLNAAGYNVEDQIWTYSTISLDFDNKLYLGGRDMAGVLVESIRLASLRFLGSRDAFIAEECKWAAKIRFHDHMVSRIRHYFEFRKRFNEYKVGKRIVYIPANGHPIQATAKVIAKMAEREKVEIYTDHLHEASLKIYNKKGIKPSAFLKKTVHALPSFSDEVLKAPHNSVVFVANVLDPQYDASLQPMLPRLLKKRSVTILNYIPARKPEWLFKEPFTEHFENGNLAYYEKPLKREKIEASDAEFKMLENAFDHFQNEIKSYADPEFRVFHTVMACYVASFGAPLLYFIRDHHALFTKLAKKSSVAVLLPGRILESNIFGGVMQTYKKPTIEIQSGTLSETQRFIRPLADEFLAIEPYSARVVQNYFGKPAKSVIVTGGIKVEFDIARVRNLPQEKAKASVPHFYEVGDTKLWVHAGQPVGVDFAKDIIEMAVKACKRMPDYTFVIKPHPNETDEYLEAYRKIAKKHKLKRFMIVRDAPILNVVKAADVVSTYFSTVGLEAFALQKPVICINPFTSPIPFDLVQLGTALQAKSEDELVERLGQVATAGFDALEYDPLLERILDGQVIDRVVDLIDTRARESISLHSPVQLRYYLRKMNSAKIRLKQLLSAG